MRQLKWLSLLALLLLGPSGLLAQSVRFQSQAISSRGAGIANATVAVCTQPANTNTQPCSPLATLATSTSTTSGGANPLTADSFGNFFFYAAPGRYTVQIYGPAVFGQLVIPDVEVPSSGGGTGTFTVIAGCQHVNSAQTFATALAAVGTSGCLAVDPGTFTVSTNATIPAGVALYSASGSTLSVANTVTLTIAGPISAPNTQIFAYVGTGTVAITNQNPVQPQWFPGANAGAQLQNAINSLPVNGGIVDAKGYGNTTQTISAPISIGSSTQKGVMLFVSNSTNYNVTVTGGVCAISIFDRSGIIGDRIGGNGSYPSGISLATTANVSALVCNGTTNGTQEYLLLDGVFLQGHPSATVSSALVDIQSVFVNSYLRDDILDFFPSIGLRIRGASGAFTGGAGPINIDNCWFNGENNTNAIPVSIESGGNTFTNNPGVITFYGGAIEHQGGAGSLPLVKIDGLGTPIHNVTFLGTYFENHNSIADNTTIAISAKDVDGLTVIGTTTGGLAGHDFLKVAQSAGSLTNTIKVMNVRNTTYTNSINDTINTYTNTIGYISDYRFLSPTTTGDNYIDGFDFTLTHPGNNSVGIKLNTTNYDLFAVNEIRQGSGGAFSFSSNADPTLATGDTFLKRWAQATVQIPTNTTGGGIALGEGTAATAGGTVDVCYGDSTAHAVKCSYNNGTFFQMPQLIASGTSTLTSNATLGAGTCQAVVTTAATGVATTDSIEWSFATNPATGDAISPVAPSVTSGNVNFTRCNPTAASQNVTAIVINWRVVR